MRDPVSVPEVAARQRAGALPARHGDRLRHPGRKDRRRGGIDVILVGDSVGTTSWATRTRFAWT